MTDLDPIERREVFRGRLLRVYVDRVTLPGGTRVEREIVRHPGAAAVLPIRQREGPSGGTVPTVVLVRQYRYAADRELWEVPAGTLERGESPEACAARELREEAGLEAAELRPMASFFTTPGFTDERIHLYVATGLRQVGAEPEPEERIRRVEMPLERALKMVREGEVMDAKTICALLGAERMVDRRATAGRRDVSEE
ncbi:MAG: NUDIX hydrolase [Gemmatimonadota bacterium]